MSCFEVVLAPAAERDIAGAFTWYRQRSEGAAEAFRLEVFDIVDRLADMALTRAADGDGLRKRILKRFPYTVFYEVDRAQVTVLAVAHQRRRPGYWQTDKG